MTATNAINQSTPGICGFTGTAFTGSPVTNHAVVVGGATSNVVGNVGPSAIAGQILQSAGASADPVFSTATYPAASGGTGKILYDNGTNFVESTPTFPTSASATSRKMIVSDGTNWVASTETWAVPGTSGNVLTSNGTNWTSATPSSPSTGGLSTVYIYDDFLATSTTTGGVGNSNIDASTGTGGGNVTAVSASGNPGIISMVTASVNNNAAGIGTGSGIIAGVGTITCQWVCKIPTLSTGTNRFKVRIGLSNTGQPNTDPTKGCWFEYADNVNSGNWQIKSGGAAITTANTNTAADTNWHNFKVIINSGNTSVSFYIDNVQVANSPIATNLPNAGFGAQASIARQVGTGGTLYADLYTLQIDLTSARPG